MTVSVLALAVDCADAAALARFWAEVLHRPIEEGASAAYAAIAATDPAGTGPRLTFHQVPEGKVVKNRLHLDLSTSAVDDESARLVALGAVPLRHLEQNGARWTTFADPEGNEFDLIG
jgi:predicted enzyme related to lactoylglutathione lyase